jgi:hypothetical protein
MVRVSLRLGVPWAIGRGHIHTSLAIQIIFDLYFVEKHGNEKADSIEKFVGSAIPCIEIKGEMRNKISLLIKEVGLHPYSIRLEKSKALFQTQSELSAMPRCNPPVLPASHTGCYHHSYEVGPGCLDPNGRGQLYYGFGLMLNCWAMERKIGGRASPGLLEL